MAQLILPATVKVYPLYFHSFLRSPVIELNKTISLFYNKDFIILNFLNLISFNQLSS